MAIKRYLIETALRKKDRLKLIEGNYATLEERVWEVWISELPEEFRPDSTVAVDGSRNRKSFAGYVLYAVGAGSVLYRDGQRVKGGERFLVDIDLLKPEEYSDARIRILMGILEFKTALLNCDSVSYILLDGSIVGAMVRPSVFNQEVPPELKAKVEELFKDFLVPNFSLSSEFPIDSARYYGELKKFASGREFAVVAGYLEYLEYLYSLYLLLKKGVDKIISVSKHSDSRNYSFDPLLPDVAVLNSLDLPPGYTKPIRVSVTKEKKFKFPEKFEEKLRGFEFYSFFFRLPKGSVLKVETALKPQDALSILRYYAVRGYPYPLRDVHELVKIKSSDVEFTVELLKHRGVTGRESLGE
ncbi:DNA double-strand break repair nuclease NurA [Phorcysia thermohydrogeniphila]|uniref:NurA-like 5'-3' nuclease n=1 Tax=Phorcysia thermohydrogeniphila TaxID=936138 RepID=A0A4R1GF50_9BACT|nr:DNA double-strand break repair nuclease NurA [Phorcysia thermohydrogeniphila]TCK06678.1 NurA-like 5'-3' nuclease [Phorcysia thermohydrogeniphila]